MKRKNTLRIKSGRYKRYAVCAVCMMMLFLSACKIGNHEIVVMNALGNRQVFKIGGTAMGLKEAGIYLANYQNIYGSAYGVDLWKHDFGDNSLVEYVKAVTLEELTQMVCMNLLAEARELSLTEDELERVKAAAAEYYGTLSEEEIGYLDVSENNIRQYYANYALARKLYNSLTSGVNEEVSEDEARVVEIMQIFVAEKAKASEVAGKLAGGDDFATVASNYNELSSIQITAARDELPKEVESVVFQLDNDEISGMIQTQDGYYFIKCLDKYNEELTEANKRNIVEKREKEAFDDVYNEFISGLSTNLNEELWNSLELNTGEAIKTDCFFEVFSKHCGDI